MRSSWVEGNSGDDARHLSFDNVDAVWAGRNPVVLPLAGTPWCELALRPVHGTISLLTAYVPPEPAVAKLRNISFRRIASGRGELAELTVDVEGNLHGVYGLLTAIADELQLGDAHFAAAVSAVVKMHKNLFASETRLSAEQEIGLFGELTVLEHLIAKLGPEDAVGAWHGPFSEEHDFVFSDVHLEVKTTISEYRRHMMHGFTQFVPLRSVPLSLISIMLTRGTVESGRTLAQMVTRIRGCAGGYRHKVDRRLEILGWIDGDVELYTTYWAKRAPNRAYSVDDRFPAITLERLRQVVPNYESLGELSYRVDLTHYNPDPLPEPLADLVETHEEQP